MFAGPLSLQQTTLFPLEGTCGNLFQERLHVLVDQVRGEIG
jgi:hypothetical protein